jgi:membrane protein DedA with SNARE-associated domain
MRRCIRVIGARVGAGILYFFPEKTGDICSYKRTSLSVTKNFSPDNVQIFVSAIDSHGRRKVFIVYFIPNTIGRILFVPKFNSGKD